MRLADAILRRGHLSEQALAEVCMTGDRPVHLERCDICAQRAVELGRWLDDVRLIGIEDADAAFPPERLAAQQTQILRRLEQLDRPARVIAFPTQSRYGQLEGQAHGIRPAWVGFAAAAGLALGLLGGQLSARLTRPAPVVAIAPVQAEQSPVATISYERPSEALLDLDENDRAGIKGFEAMDELTPRVRFTEKADPRHYVVLRSGQAGRQ